MRRLVQADQPAEARSAEELSVEVEKNYQWNFATNAMDVTWFWFGLAFISSTTIVPLFISKLTPNPFFIGLAAIIAQGAWYFPQLLAANPIERLARKKPVVVNLGFFSERLPLWVIALAPPLALISPALSLAVFLLGYAWHGFGAGFVAPAWQELIARCFPMQRRGRFLGFAMFLGAIAGAIGALISIRILGAYPYPTNFTIIFVFAAAGISFSWIFLALVREPVQPSTLPRQTNRQYFAGLPNILDRDHRFRRYIFARLLLVFGAMGSTFVTPAAIHYWQIPDSKAGVYTFELLVGQIIGNLVLGSVADRFGHRLTLRLGALAAALAYALVWLSPLPISYDIAFVLLGMQLASVIVSGILITLEFAPAERTPTYVGLVNTAVGTATLVAPLIAASLASVNYSVLFIISAIFNLASWAAFRWFVPEPRSTLV
ncbi:MAG: MFS transporter [Caldilineales bacterium]|nr:MFS transporter [Caldilineales bacterium]